MELDEESKDLWRAVVAAAQRAVAQCPGNVAEIAVRDEDLSMEIRPRRGDAAGIEIGFNGIDEVYLRIGLTDAWLWQVDSKPLTETVHNIVAAVMAGSIEEAGSFTASARLQTPDGEVRLGSQQLLPIPWAWRLRRTYAPYS